MNSKFNPFLWRVGRAWLPVAFILILSLLIYGFLYGVAALVPVDKEHFVMSHKVGNMDGVPVAIPKEYLSFPDIEYEDHTMWEGNTGKEDWQRTFYDKNDRILDYIMSVHWPDMKPRSEENNASYWESTRSAISNWMDAGMRSYLVRSPEGVLSYPRGIPPEWLARELKGRIRGDRVQRENIHYEIMKNSSITGLQEAVPVGPNANDFEIVYWNGDINSEITTMIICSKGDKRINPRLVVFCNHEFIVLEFRAIGFVSYSYKWLPQWRLIQDKFYDLMLSFRVEEPTPDPRIYWRPSRAYP